MNIQDADYWIRHLNLIAHPEGGYYKEVFRSKQEVLRISSSDLKQSCTSIYYLLKGNDFSAFHRLSSDELWYFHKGEPLLIYAFNERGLLIVQELSDQDSGNLFVAIEAGSWFGGVVPSGTGFSLVSCVVAPGFDFSEFEMADKHELNRLYPEHVMIINRFSR